MSKKVKNLMIVVSVLGFLGGVGAYYYATYEYAQDKAEDELAEYLTKMYNDRTVLGKQCTGRDSDGDGYISCDARVLAQNGVEEKFTVECAATFFNSGCKTKQMLPGSIEATMR